MNKSPLYGPYDVKTPEQAHAAWLAKQKASEDADRSDASSILRRLQLRDVFNRPGCELTVKVYSRGKDAKAYHTGMLPLESPPARQRDTVLAIVKSELEQNGWWCEISRGWFNGAVYLHISPGAK